MVTETLPFAVIPNAAVHCADQVPATAVFVAGFVPDGVTTRPFGSVSFVQADAFEGSMMVNCAPVGTLTATAWPLTSVVVTGLGRRRRRALLRLVDGEADTRHDGAADGGEDVASHTHISLRP